MSKKMYTELKQADSEKIIESIYHKYLTEGLQEVGGVVEQPKTLRKTDGVIDGTFVLDGNSHVFRIIVETKFNETFKQATVRAKALIQVLYYMYDFEQNGVELPNIILVGDKDECFVLHSNYLQKYLSVNDDWSSAPSQAYRNNVKLLSLIADDETLQENCFVHMIDEDFKFHEVIDEIKALTLGHKHEVRLTNKNIRKIFEYFITNVLKRKASGESVYKPREQVEYFMQLVLDIDNCYVHPKKKGKGVFNGKDIDVDTANLTSFLNRYTFNYNAQEKKEFTEIADQLIEESDRRLRGDFYTPTLWVDEAHKMLNETLGYDWKEKYMVWDSAWGTGNLTRDYNFFDLYASSLHEHDLEIARNYNKGSVKFQYDFLNDDVEKLEELRKAKLSGVELTVEHFKGTKLYQYAPNLVHGLLGNKQLLFFINPPYGSAKNGGKVKGNSKDIGTSKIKELMIKDKVNGEVTNLYVEFLYRIKLLQDMFNTNIDIAVFSPPLYLSGMSYKKFRNEFLKNYDYKEGFLLCAGEFADTSSAWGIAFSILTNTKEENTDIAKTFQYAIKTMENGKVSTVGEKNIYNLEDGLADKLRKTTKHIKETVDYPYLSSAIQVKEKGYSKFLKGSMGQFYCNSNNVYQNAQGVALLTGNFTGFNTINIYDFNILEVFKFFTARKLITGNHLTWVNCKDEYMLPNESHAQYKQWELDSIIYSLFNISSNQSSLRSVDYNGIKWAVKNEFFFMSQDEMQQLSLKHNNDDVYNDIQDNGGERHVYELIQQNTGKFSTDAQAVLDKAVELVKLSFDKRKFFNDTNPEYHINTWDAGWYQIKGLLKEYHPQELKEFNELYKKFEDRMRPLVYELGFLYE